MTADYIEEEPQPQKIGRCNIDVRGNRPAGCGVAIFDNDPDAIPLGKDGMMGGKCYSLLFNARPWSTQLGTAESAAQSAGGKKSKALNNPFIRLPGSKDVDGRGRKAGSASTTKRIGGHRWREKSKRKQPWGMERP